MKRKSKLKYFSLLLVVIFIGIGYAFLSTNLEINGISIMKRSVWDLHFENIVDDYEKAVIDIPASISRDRLSVNFEVTLNNPGDEYYFYVDVVNDGTIDVMLNNYLFSGLSTEQEKLISTTLTYNDGVAVNKYDLLKENSFDTLKVSVKFREDIEVSDLPTTKSDFNLSLEVNFDQADSNAKEREHIADVTPPRIKFIKVNDNSGNDEWSKDIRLLVKIVDESKIKEAKYCITTPDNECEPTEVPEELQNTSFYFTFPESDTEQRLCVKATDTNDNSKTTCTTESYLVDGEDPVIKNVNLTKENNSITVEVDAEDKQSGIYMYYYSKDSGETYIPSIYPNYTFTGLDNDDYLITMYTEDVAGNKSAVTAKNSTVRSGNFCKSNGLTNLSDCLLAQETRDANIVSAKSKIEAKETPNFNDVSPKITYGEKEMPKVSVYKASTSQSFYLSDGSSYSYNYYYVGTDYQLNTSTGQFTLKNTKQIKDFGDLDNQNNTYYMCGSQYSSSCSTMFKIISIDFLEETNTDYSFYTTKVLKFNITKYDITYKELKYDSKETGMYSIEDDLGTSYYYRGAVEGNIVKFGDFYWKITRINGDGTIRMIFYGTSPTTDSQVSVQYYTPNNSSYRYDPTYMGIMFNNEDFGEELKPTVSTYTGFEDKSTTSYVYSKSYTYNRENSTFSLDLTEGNYIKGIWKDTYEEILNNGYIYTCATTSTTASANTCRKIKKVTRYEYNEKQKQHRMYYTDYLTSSTSYENAVKNVKKSQLLIKLDEWFETNIKTKTDSNSNSLLEYLSDGIFCNDRSFYSGNGYYSYGSMIYYNGYGRLKNNMPSLLCVNQNDRFTESDTTNGNGALENRVGLITADEVELSGVNNNTSYKNNHYFLKWGSRSFWTITPYYDNGDNEYVYKAYSSGGISSEHIGNSGHIRPVINLKANTKIVSGEGTTDSPFEITLGN